MVQNGRLQDKVAVVTGGSSGIGAGIVKLFKKEGAKVVIFDLKEPQEEFGDQCVTVRCDVSKEEEIEKGVAVAVDRFGRLDIFINCAGWANGSPLVNMSHELWDTTIKVCLYGTFYGTKHAAKQMIKQGEGVVINISSLNSTVPGGGLAAYCAAKAGVDMLTQVAAMELGPQNIRVCAINPGFIDTPLNKKFLDIPMIVEEIIDKTPLKRIGKPEEIAKTALFLASDEASFITGSTLYVDGGQSKLGYPNTRRILKKLEGEKNN